MSRGSGTSDATKTDGRYADVELLRCTRCHRLWLRYFVDDEAFSRSDRWAEALIDDATAERITPEAAAAFIDRAPWPIIGGSYYDGTVRRSKGPFHWGL